MAITIAGIVVLIAGILLHLWTGKLLGFFGLIGLPEISASVKGGLVTKGAFSVVRHPTYLAHTLILLGVFLMTGEIVVGLITVIDFLLVNLAIIPLEERELLGRFGKEYERYRGSVPRYFPRIRVS